MIPHEIKLSDLASNCVFYFATADGKESGSMLKFNIKNENYNFPEKVVQIQTNNMFLLYLVLVT